MGIDKDKGQTGKHFKALKDKKERQNRTKEQIAGFLSPYLMNIVSKDVHFTLRDLLEDVGTVPSHLLENYPTSSKPNKEIEVKFIKLV